MTFPQHEAGHFTVAPDIEEGFSEAKAVVDD
jgi:hypothetical protein